MEVAKKELVLVVRPLREGALGRQLSISLSLIFKKELLLREHVKKTCILSEPVP